MIEERFDAIVVGAGMAGNTTALMAKRGTKVLQLERGEYAGSKNVHDASLYADILEKLIPDFREDVLARARTSWPQLHALRKACPARRYGINDSCYVETTLDCRVECGTCWVSGEPTGDIELSCPQGRYEVSFKVRWELNMFLYQS